MKDLSKKILALFMVFSIVFGSPLTMIAVAESAVNNLSEVETPASDTKEEQGATSLDLPEIDSNTEERITSEEEVGAPVEEVVDSQDETIPTEEKNTTSEVKNSVVEEQVSTLFSVIKKEIIEPLTSKKETGFVFDESNTIATIETVELGVTYVAPQNSQVQITFTKLPEVAGSLSIEEVILTDEQVAQFGALSNVAYDITSNMENGTFEYDLKLPTPANTPKETKVIFAENVEALENGNINTVPDEKVSAAVLSNTLTVSELDHFTIFVVTRVSESFAGLGWVADRTFPTGGIISETADVLKYAINGSKSSSTPFYKTEGVKATLPSGKDSVKATLKIDSDWSTVSNVRAGLWLVAYSGSSVASYPIIEFTNFETNPRLRVWSSADAGWFDIDKSISYGSSVDLEVVKNSFTDKFEFYADGVLVYSYAANGDDFKEIILNGFNDGHDYTIEWSNLELGVVTEVKIKPTIAFVSPLVANTPYSGSVPVTVTASDNESGLASLVINVKGADGQTHLGSCGSGLSSLGGISTTTYDCTLDVSEYADGLYHLRAGTNDVSGNNKTTQIAFVVDNTAPNISWQKQPEAFYGIGSSFHVRPITSEVGTSKTVYIDSIAPENLVWTLTNDHKNFDTKNTHNQTLWDGLADGTHKFIAVFEDYAGNTTVSESNTFIIDRTAPIIEVRNPKGDSSLKIFSEVGFGYNDSNKVTHAVFNQGETGEKIHNFGDAVWSNTDKVWSNRGWTGVHEGLNTVTVYDMAGNSTTLEFTIDTTAPTVKLLAPLDNSTVTSLPLDIVATVEDANLKHYWYKLEKNGSIVEDKTVLSQGIDSKIIRTISTEGNYKITLAARDLADNRSGDVVISFVIDIPDSEEPEGESETPETPTTPTTTTSSVGQIIGGRIGSSTGSDEGEVLGATVFNFRTFMKLGSKGGEVPELQKFLNEKGYGQLVVDGIFGPLTKAAVMKFQADNGLVADGIVGPLTRAVLNK